jgi:IS5 family transposase
MRFEDWTFREAEVRLSEHRELRAALELDAMPDHTALYRFLSRLQGQDLRRVLGEIVRRVPRRYRRRARVAADANGLEQNAISSFFIRRMHHHTQQPMPWRHWLKCLTVVDVDRQLILAQSARQAPWNDCANLPALVAEARQLTPIGCVLADAEFDSERNHAFCRECPKANSIIPAKRGKKTWKIHGVRAPRCAIIFRRKNMGAGRWWKPSSQPPSVNSAAVRRAVAPAVHWLRLPSGEGRTVQIDAFAREDFSLAIEWQMVTVLRHQHMGQERRSSQAPFDRP